MKIKIIISSSIVIVVALSVAYYGVHRKMIDRVYAQIGGGCNDLIDDQNQCGNSVCGIGYYDEVVGSNPGDGTDGLDQRFITCPDTECEGDFQINYSYFNGYCCDQDYDGFQRTSCGGTDCNDDPNNNGYNINPGKAEICDGIDNNCANGVDEGFDQDNDGFKTCTGDCNDNNANINPNAPEICIDSAENDENCNGYSNCDDEICQYSSACGGCHGACEPQQICFGGMCISPIVIDVAGNGFNLTNAQNGVTFDIRGNNRPIKISWTAANSDDSWLALDRNNNGTIDSGKELFGNFTPQPEPPLLAEKNGFLALAEYDKSANGGNGDNKINDQDAIFDDLKLWRDINHNGISETNELQNLSASPIRQIDLNYQLSLLFDLIGNRFKYRARVRDAQGAQVGRWAYDVYLMRELLP